MGSSGEGYLDTQVQGPATYDSLKAGLAAGPRAHVPAWFHGVAGAAEAPAPPRSVGRSTRYGDAAGSGAGGAAAAVMAASYAVWSNRIHA